VERQNGAFPLSFAGSSPVMFKTRHRPAPPPGKATNQFRFPARSMKLDLSSLEGAVATLDRSVKAAAAHAASIPRELQDTVRSGIIQNFEVAYELSWKMIKRWIESNVGPDSADGVTRRELFRLAAESRLLEDVDLWMRFHNARNESSHTYDQETAEEVGKCAGDFAPAARALLSSLGARND